MSTIERAVSKLENQLRILQFLKDRYPKIIEELKNNNAGAYEAPADKTTVDVDVFSTGVNYGKYKE